MFFGIVKLILRNHIQAATFHKKIFTLPIALRLHCIKSELVGKRFRKCGTSGNNTKLIFFLQFIKPFFYVFVFFHIADYDTFIAFYIIQSFIPLNTGTFQRCLLCDNIRYVRHLYRFKRILPEYTFFKKLSLYVVSSVYRTAVYLRIPRQKINFVVSASVQNCLKLTSDIPAERRVRLFENNRNLNCFCPSCNIFHSIICLSCRHWSGLRIYNQNLCCLIYIPDSFRHFCKYLGGNSLIHKLDSGIQCTGKVICYDQQLYHRISSRYFLFTASFVA